MDFNFRIEKIDPDLIDIEKSPFVWSETNLPAHLVESIKNEGLLNPPIVYQGNYKRYMCVSGARRVKIARVLNVAKMPVRVPENMLSLEELFKIAIADNGGRQLNVVEAAFICKGLKNMALLPEGRIIKEYLPRMGYHSGEKIFKNLMLLSEMNNQILYLMADGYIPLQNVGLLVKFSPADRLLFSDVIRAYRPGTNKQRLLLEIGHDLCRREKIRLEKVLSDCGFLPIPDSDEKNIPQRFEESMYNLRKLMFPLMIRKEEKFNRVKNRLKKVSGVSLEHFPFFEKNVYTLRIDFRSENDLKKTLNELQKTVSNSTLSSLFEHLDFPEED